MAMGTEQRADLNAILDRLKDEELERGARLCDAGNISPDRHRDAVAVIEYWHSQREAVARRGECTGGCAAWKLVELGWRKEIVCRQTGEPCKRSSLAAIVELWSKINS